MSEQILTARLLIRRFSADDWQDLYEYLSQEEVVRFEPYGVFTAEECKAEAARRAGDDDFWAVCLKNGQVNGGKLIGNNFLQKQEFDTWELGFVFNLKYQGKGYATEAAAALIGYVYRAHNAHRVIARCNPDNSASWKLLERLGMRREGHLRKDVFFERDENGRPVWLDTYEYGVLGEEL